MKRKKYYSIILLIEVFYSCFFPNLAIIRGDTRLYSPTIAYQQNHPCKV